MIRNQLTSVKLQATKVMKTDGNSWTYKKLETMTSLSLSASQTYHIQYINSKSISDLPHCTNKWP